MMKVLFKMRWTGLCTLLMLLLVVGCSRNSSDTPPDVVEQKVPLQLSAKRVVTKTETYSDLPIGLVTGVYVTDNNALIADSYFSNWQYTAVTAGSLASSNGNMILTAGRSYDVYAYSPYNKDVVDATAIPVAHGTDVLWSPKVTIIKVSDANNTASLTFRHSMSQVAFNAVFAPDFAADVPILDANSTIQVTGFYGTGTLNATTGVVTPTGDANIVLAGSAKGIPGAMTLGVDATMIIPSVNMTFLVKVMHLGKTYNGNIKVTPLVGNLSIYSVVIRGVAPNVPLGIEGKVTDWVNTTAQSDLE